MLKMSSAPMHLSISFILFILMLNPASIVNAQGGGWRDLETRTIKMGPIEVPANDMKMALADFEKPIKDEDFAWVTFDLKLVDENDNEIKADSIYLHHLVVGSFNKKSVMCRDPTGERSPLGRVCAVGSDFTGTRLSFPFAYHTPKSEQWKAGYHLLSHEPVAKQVWFKYTFSVLRYADGKRPDALRPVEVVWLDVQEDCRAEFDVPGSKPTDDFTDRLFVKSRTWTSPFTGIIPMAIGHVHRGGLEIILSHNNKVLCPSKAIYAPENNGYISSMGTCHHIDEPIKIGDTLEVVTLYNNTEPIQGAMGIFLAYAYITEFNLHPNELTKSDDSHEDSQLDSLQRLTAVGLAVVLTLIVALLALTVVVLIVLVKLRRPPAYTEMNAFSVEQ